ncbi:copper chaperone PCu(A)C [Methylibium petroleiphilum]|uniref:copper chaperone PCu(A)C n=1 Tax=Methylibium petroleiphilum TaxID=105560 RepID=UPI003D2DB65E
MRLTAQKDVVLTGASSPVADIVEVHEMWMDKGIMRMRPAELVPLARSVTVADGSVSTVEVNATAAFAPPTR